MGATGEKVNIDPETFELLNGKLYLFYNQFFNNTKKTWDKDVKSLRPKADANWAKYVRLTQLLQLINPQVMSNNINKPAVLITAGPTREAIDPVRYITNHSSGKMGYAIAEAF